MNTMDKDRAEKIDHMMSQLRDIFPYDDPSYWETLKEEAEKMVDAIDDFDNVAYPDVSEEPAECKYMFVYPADPTPDKSKLQTIVDAIIKVISDNYYDREQFTIDLCEEIETELFVINEYYNDKDETFIWSVANKLGSIGYKIDVVLDIMRPELIDVKILENISYLVHEGIMALSSMIITPQTEK